MPLTGETLRNLGTFFPDPNPGNQFAGAGVVPSPAGSAWSNSRVPSGVQRHPLRM